jgi:hypothetical protein
MVYNTIYAVFNIICIVLILYILPFLYILYVNDLLHSLLRYCAIYLNEYSVCLD